MIEKYRHLREAIKQYNCEMEYEKSINESFKLFELLSKDNASKDDEWFCHYMVSYNYYLLKEYELASEYGKYAALIIKNIDDSNYNRTIWHLGNCYKKTGDIKEAIRMFKICSYYYKSIKSNKLRLTCLYNIAELLEYTGAMEKILKLYTVQNESHDPTVYMQDTYEKSVIHEMYIGAVNLYIAQNKNDRAFRLINSIWDKELKKQLSKKLLVA